MLETGGIEEGECFKLALLEGDEEGAVKTLDDSDGEVEAPVDC